MTLKNKMTPLQTHFTMNLQRALSMATLVASLHKNSGNPQIPLFLSLFLSEHQLSLHSKDADLE